MNPWTERGWEIIDIDGEGMDSDAWFDRAIELTEGEL